MAKITEFDRVTEISSTDLYLIDNDDDTLGTRVIAHSDLLGELMTDDTEIDTIIVGTVDVSGVTEEGCDDVPIDISFGTTFASAPLVFCSPYDVAYPVTVDAVTTTGAELSIRRGFVIDDSQTYLPSTAKCYYVAMGVLAT